MKNAFVLLALCCAFFSCKNPSQEPVRPGIRAVLKSTGTGGVKASVFVEGPDGNSLSGAVVTVLDTRNALLQLSYDSVACSYNGITEELPGESSYIIEVTTMIFPEKLRLTAPYSRLSDAPNITVFQDAAGNSVLHGQSIESSQPVQIGWEGSGEGIVYQAVIKTALKTVYSVSTNANTVTVPEDTIPAGSYLLELSAQKIHGDAFFSSASYYSLSFINAPPVSCDVN
ncbi:MAG: hypothetical protein LBG95_08550 [Treponema sp.]|jgi:hypothetical protein|nr:hypothetical protein [Treponema sp.]